MTAYGTPAAAGPAPDPTPFIANWRDWLRLVGGILFAAGAVVLAIRKTSEWGEWALFLVYGIPCAALYLLALLRRGRGAVGLEGWQSGYVTFAALLLPAALLQLADALGADTGNRLTVAVVFAVSAAIPAFVALWAGAWWQMLIAGLYVIVAWLAFWAKVLDHPSPNTIRVLILIIAVILLAVGLLLGWMRRSGASDLITAAGIAGILAGAISLAGLSAGLDSVAGSVSDGTPKPSQAWNVYILVVSLVLIAYGAKSRTRGPGYVGAVGLIIFIGLTGSNIVTRINGGDFSDLTSVVGWPLLLLILGGVAIVASFLAGGSDGGVGAESTFGHPEAGAGGATPLAQPAGGETVGGPATAPPPATGRPPGAEHPTQQRPMPPALPGDEQATQQRPSPGPPPGEAR
jgi:hypothetical protein